MNNAALMSTSGRSQTATCVHAEDWALFASMRTSRSSSALTSGSSSTPGSRVTRTRSSGRCGPPRRSSSTSSGFTIAAATSPRRTSATASS
ncbi:hypothetical protein WMF01_42095 [Sorangium sp. So ce1667]